MGYQLAKVNNDNKFIEVFPCWEIYINFVGFFPTATTKGL